MHGEQNEMQRLKSALEREYENDPDTKITVHNPKNTMPVELYFTGEKTVKVNRLTYACHYAFRRLRHRKYCATGYRIVSRRKTDAGPAAEWNFG